MKLQNKLFLFLLGFSLLLVSLLVLLMQWSIGKGMVDYVNTKELEVLSPVVDKLEDNYQLTNSWQDMFGNHRKFKRLISAQLKDSEFDLGSQRLRVPDAESRGNPPELTTKTEFARDATRRLPPLDNRGAHYALLDVDGSLVAGRYFPSLEYSSVPIFANGQQVGSFAVSMRHRLIAGYELDFIQQQTHYLWLIGLICMVLVAVLTFPLARHLVLPIKRITYGMHKLTQGHYHQSIPQDRKDELGQLSRDFNELALTLVENESTRKRWLANISHELRTPVAILRGELEAMLDKIRPINEANIGSAYEETKHLQRLIDDLNLLTCADIGGMQYRKQTLELNQFLQPEVEKYAGYLMDSAIALTFVPCAKPINIYCDNTRLCQLFENIIHNCVKYSSASELRIELSVVEAKGEQDHEPKYWAKILFSDNGVGVEAEHLPHLFEHLYRVENSRNRQTGGSGLGLSICHHIVKAHHGEIMAKQSSSKGLDIVITLPLESDYV